MDDDDDDDYYYITCKNGLSSKNQSELFFSTQVLKSLQS